MQAIRRKSPWIAAATILLPHASSAQPTLQTAAKWREDVAFVMETMKRVHPAPFHRVPEATFDAKARALTAAIPTLSDQQIAVRLAAIVSLLHDGHSRLAFGEPFFKRNTAFPVRLHRFADGIRVIATRPGDSTFLGARVERIGNLPAVVAWDSLTTISSGDNDFSRITTTPLLMTIADYTSELRLSSRDSLVMTVTGPGTAPSRRFVVRAESAAFNVGWYFNGTVGPAGATHTIAVRGLRKLVEERRALAYWFNEDARQIYAQINQIGDTRDTVPLGSQRDVVTLAQFGQRIFARIDAGAVDKLVIDLRYNGGGNNELARAIVNGLVARPAINQRGRLFVITGRDTYSAAMNFVSMLEDRTEALFVGEPPGGSPLHYGDAMPFTLPNSKLQVRVSTLHWDTGVRPSDVREVMEMDLPAPPLFADLVSGNDAAFNAISSYNERSRLADVMLARYRADGLDSALAEYDRRHAITRNLDPLWQSDVQQLLEFATAVIRTARQRDDIFKAFEAATTRFPDSHVAWFERGRVLAFVNQWKEVAAAYEKATALRPQNNVIRRMRDAALRR